MGLFRRGRVESRSDLGHHVRPSGAGTNGKVGIPLTGREGPALHPDPGAKVFDDVPVWFRRLAEVPGFQGVLLDRPTSSQPEHAERPWVYFGCDPITGEVKFRNLQWPGSIGSDRWPPSEFGHGWSPAQRVAFGGEDLGPTASIDDVVQALWPALDLPGVGIDYHFLLQNAVERLWKIRDVEEGARQALIRVAELDRSLAEAHPDSLTIFGVDRNQFVGSRSLERLAAVYEQLGDLQAAFDVTVFASRFDQLESRRRRLAKKLGHVNLNRETE